MNQKIVFLFDRCVKFYLVTKMKLDMNHKLSCSMHVLA